jgi:hypothetical protein
MVASRRKENRKILDIQTNVVLKEKAVPHQKVVNDRTKTFERQMLTRVHFTVDSNAHDSCHDCA